MALYGRGSLLEEMLNLAEIKKQEQDRERTAERAHLFHMTDRQKYITRDDLDPRMWRKIIQTLFERI